MAYAALHKRRSGMAARRKRLGKEGVTGEPPLRRAIRPLKTVRTAFKLSDLPIRAANAGWNIRRQASASRDALLAFRPQHTAVASARRKKSGRESRMFSHVMIGTNDLEKAKSFYDALLATLDVRPARVDGHRIFYMTKTGVFAVSKPINGQPRQLPMVAPSALSATRPSRSTPGMRPASPMAGRRARTYREFARAARAKVYLAYLRDLDGNKICASHRMA